MEDAGKNRVEEGDNFKRRGVEEGVRPSVLIRKVELEKVKVEAIKTEGEREKIRERGKEWVPVKVQVGEVDVLIVHKKGKLANRKDKVVRKGKGSVVGEEGVWMWRR